MTRQQFQTKMQHLFGERIKHFSETRQFSDTFHLLGADGEVRDLAITELAKERGHASSFMRARPEIVMLAMSMTIQKQRPMELVYMLDVPLAVPIHRAAQQLIVEENLDMDWAVEKNLAVRRHALRFSRETYEGAFVVMQFYQKGPEKIVFEEQWSGAEECLFLKSVDAGQSLLRSREAIPV